MKREEDQAVQGASGLISSQEPAWYPSSENPEALIEKGLSAVSSPESGGLTYFESHFNLQSKGGAC